MRALSVVLPVQTPEELAKHLEEDTKRDAEVIRVANIKLE